MTVYNIQAVPYYYVAHFIFTFRDKKAYYYVLSFGLLHYFDKIELTPTCDKKKFEQYNLLYKLLLPFFEIDNALSVNTTLMVNLDMWNLVGNYC